MTNEKIGIGIVTCNRNEFFDNLLKSLFVRGGRDKIDYIVGVNDGEPFDYQNTLHGCFFDDFIDNKTNLGVGKSKNILFRKLLEQQCDHIFIIEDDMVIKDVIVFEKYIEASKTSGLKHLLYGYHGPANKVNEKPMPLFAVPYPNDIKIAYNIHCVGSFCYYHKSVLEDVGIFDEKYTNAWEHVDHSYNIVKAGYLPGYWYWPDLANSMDYIGEQACSENNSTIRPREDWRTNIINGAHHFKEKHNYLPVEVPTEGRQVIYEKIKIIKEKHGQN